jgi:branched-chain amino acid transport system permease protein
MDSKGFERSQPVKFAPYFLGGLILAVIPPFLHSYYQIIMTKVLIFGLAAMSLDVAYGYTGLFSFGHGAFFGAAGYTTGLLMARYGIESFWIGAPLGILMATIVAALFGLIALRVSGVYFLLVTFALGQLLVSLGTKWRFLSTSTGTEGVIGILRPDLGIPGFRWTTTNFYYFVLIVFAICFYLLSRLISSPFGLALQGIRESEPRMRALGYNTWLCKYIAFIVAGLFAGVAGVLIAYQDGFMVPSSFGVNTSAIMMLMVIIGGVGTLYGPVIGAVIIIYVELFASMYTPERWPLILGAAYVLAVMYVRGGISVYLSRFWEKRVMTWKH